MSHEPGEVAERVATATWNAGVADVAAPVAGADAGERYELREELGRGGMAIVRAAFDRTLGRRVAIKLLHPEQVHAAGRARLAREAQALAQLRHRNVVAVYDVGAIGGHDFLAMELIEGTSLRAWMKGRRWREQVRMFVAAGRGLAAAHAAGLVHRDFKPDNVLVDTDGTPRVGDFGLARLADAEPELATGSQQVETLARSVTRTDAVVGTLGYVAPEVLAGGAADARADQFAFAVSLVEALTGARPFTGATPADQAAAIARGPAIPRVASAPVRIALTRALAAEPDARFPAMDGLLAALERALGRRRRWALVGGGAAAAGVTAAFALVLGRGAEDRPACAADPHALDGVWDAARRDALTRGFTAAAPAYGATVAADVVASLDGYAAELQAALLAACTAAASPAQTAEVTNLRAACLQRRRDQLGLLVDALARAREANAIARAPVVIADLPPIADCADVTALLRPATVPADPALAAQVDDVRRAIDRIMIENRASNARAVIDDAVALLPRATALHHLPTEAEALHALAVSEDGVDRIAQAAEHDGAALLAAQAGHHDELVVRAGVTLSLVLGKREGKPAEGVRWAELAVATADGLGKPPRLEFSAHFALVILARLENRFDDAEREGAIALQYADSGRVPDLMVAELMNALGSVALMRGDYALARPRYQRARELAQPHVGDDHPMVAMIDSNLASVALALGENAQVLALRRRIAEVNDRTLGPTAARSGESWLAYAETQYLLGDPGALVTGRRAAATVLAAPGVAPARALDIRARLANLLAETGEVAEAQTLATQVLADATALGPAGAGPRFTADAALALIALRGRDRAAAGEAVARVMADLAPAGNDRTATAAVRRFVARLQRLRGDHVAAEAAASEARAMLAATDGKATVTVGEAALDQGLARLARGDRDGAIEPLTTAAALLVGPFIAADRAEAVAALARAQQR